MQKSAAYWDGYYCGLKKIGFKHPLTETGDFRDATPEEWAAHQKDRSNRMVKNLGTAAGIVPGTALGYLASLGITKKPILRAAISASGAAGGGLVGRLLGDQANKDEASNITQSQWAEGLNNYNKRWEKENS